MSKYMYFIAQSYNLEDILLDTNYHKYNNKLQHAAHLVGRPNIFQNQ